MVTITMNITCCKGSGVVCAGIGHGQGLSLESETDG